MIGLMLRFGLLLSFFTVLLQISVFLQPLLPEKFQIAPVCETITRALSKVDHINSHHSHQTLHDEHHVDVLSQPPTEHDHHDPSHQCQYCTVYSNLVLPPDHDIKQVLVSIKVHFIWLQLQFDRVYFALQRLFLLPQGRAPPVLA